MKFYDWDKIYQRADRLRKNIHGDKVHLRGLIEFSNFCRRSCYYCGLRKENRRIKRYRMKNKEIIAAAETALNLGYGTVVLQSGEDPYITKNMMTEIIKEIKVRTGLAVTLSLGERTKEEYVIWKEAGADRYLLRFETSDPDLYQNLHPYGSLSTRLKHLHWLKEIGYQVGSGSLVGLPGQSEKSLLADLDLYRSLELDMVGIGPYLVNPDTPLADKDNGSLDLTYKMIALTRIKLPYAHLPATTALGSLDRQGREKALQIGANVMMPNVTPKKYRSDYKLYPNKICTDETPFDCSLCVPGRLKSIKRYPAKGPGHALF
ncbi:MAG: [FeFe] hydrogenase H-cluster radical SAM maturase HydE [Bacillota bacterium]